MSSKLSMTSLLGAGRRFSSVIAAFLTSCPIVNATGLLNVLANHPPPPLLMVPLGPSMELNRWALLNCARRDGWRGRRTS